MEGGYGRKPWLWKCITCFHTKGHPSGHIIYFAALVRVNEASGVDGAMAFADVLVEGIEESALVLVVFNSG